MGRERVLCVFVSVRGAWPVRWVEYIIPGLRPVLGITARKAWNQIHAVPPEFILK